jgi:hypothetical protein
MKQKHSGARAMRRRETRLGLVAAPNHSSCLATARLTQALSPRLRHFRQLENRRK